MHCENSTESFVKIVAAVNFLSELLFGSQTNGVMEFVLYVKYDHSFGKTIVKTRKR